MIKKGFTLAEVLITLGIIGVIAALTLPALNIDVQKQKIGPTLAKAVNTLENSNKLAMAENDVRSLASISDNYIDILSAYTAGTTDGNNYKTNDGIEYIIGETGSKENTPSKYNGSYQIIDIDINGSNKNPNVAGKDLFRVYVDMSGAVIPYGGKLYAEYTNDSVLWNTKCIDKTITDGYSCTGSIADNGWNVKYNPSAISSSSTSSSTSSSSGSPGDKPERPCIIPVPEEIFIYKLFAS